MCQKTMKILFATPMFIVVCLVAVLITVMMHFESNKQSPEERKELRQKMAEQQPTENTDDRETAENALCITQKSMDGVDLLYEPIAYEILSQDDFAASDRYPDKYIKDKSILTDKDEQSHSFLFVRFQITNRSEKPYYDAMDLYSFTEDADTGEYIYSDMLCYFDGTDLSLDAEERKHHFFRLRLENGETAEYTVGFDIPKYDSLGKNTEYYVGIPTELEKDGEDMKYETNTIAVKDIPEKTND